MHNMDFPNIDWHIIVYTWACQFTGLKPVSSWDLSRSDLQPLLFDIIMSNDNIIFFLSSLN